MSDPISYIKSSGGGVDAQVIDGGTMPRWCNAISGIDRIWFNKTTHKLNIKFNMSNVIYLITPTGSFNFLKSGAGVTEEIDFGYSVAKGNIWRLCLDLSSMNGYPMFGNYNVPPSAMEVSDFIDALHVARYSDKIVDNWVVLAEFDTLSGSIIAPIVGIGSQEQFRTRADVVYNISKGKFDGTYVNIDFKSPIYIVTPASSFLCDISDGPGTFHAGLPESNGNVYTICFKYLELADRVNSIRVDGGYNNLGVHTVSDIENAFEIVTYGGEIPYGSIILGWVDSIAGLLYWNYEYDTGGRHFGSFSILGDSYSTFEGHTTDPEATQWYPANVHNPNVGNDVNDVEQTWWYRFAGNYGCKLDKNNSWSGSTVCYDGYGSGTVDAKTISFVTRVENLGSPELIIIEGGTNDSWVDAGMGDYIYSGWTEDDFQYFRPSLAYVIDYCLKHYIGAKVVFMLNNGLSQDIQTSVHTICDHYSVPCLNLANVDKAGSHPTDQGMSQISEQLIAFLQ